MMDSLGEILGKMGAEGLEGLRLKETELREWESTLFRINMEQQDVTGKLGDILANDVFSYVEEALMRENDGGCVLGSLRQATEPINRLPAHNTANPNTLGMFPHSQSSLLPGNKGFNGVNGSHSENRWQMGGPHITSKLNSYEEQRLLNNGVVSGVAHGVGCSPGIVGEPHSVVNTNILPKAAHTFAGQRTQGSGVYLHGNRTVPQPSHINNQPESWIPSIQNIILNNHSPVPLPNFYNILPEAFDQTMQPSLELYHSGTGDAKRQFSGLPCPGPSYQDPRQPWQQPRQSTQWQPWQIPQCFPAKPVNGLSHTQPKHTTHIQSNNASRTQTLTPSGNCMFEKNPSNISGLTPAQNRSHGPIPAPTQSNGPRPTPILSNDCRISFSTQAPKFFVPYPEASLIPRPSYPQTAIPNPTYPTATIPNPIPALSKGAQPGEGMAALPAWSRAPYLGMKHLPGPFPRPQLVPRSSRGDGSCNNPSKGSLTLGERGLEGSLFSGCQMPGFPPENGPVQSSLFYTGP
uniref:tyrosine-protein phosphatase non-receptor type 23-like isoform X1 n=1 Tax=Oncorhynchus gorbuscha TaxID=8017 RepID=UPI001EAE884E|nr:tyrosine-protein phosphatase non-receptor type 23-like isoform X1 [Oncorhynchus gorbuscha]